MREYCKRAAEYGKQPIDFGESPQTVTVILNPNANKRKAVKYYEKYCAPILNQAGMCIDVVQTQSEGHAKELVKKYAESDAIVVAGGDGTLSEVVTGILRNQTHSHINTPLGKKKAIDVTACALHFCLQVFSLWGKATRWHVVSFPAKEGRVL